MSTSTKSKRFTEVKLGVKFPSVWSNASGYSRGYYRNRTSLPGVSETLAKQVDRFTSKVVLYTRGDDPQKYIRVEKEFPVGGGKPVDVKRKLTAALDFISENEGSITRIEGGSYYSNPNTLFVTAYLPASQDDLDLFETEKVRAQALVDEVTAAKEKHKQAKAEAAAAQREREKAAAAQRRAAEKKAADARKAKEKAEAERNTVGHAMKVLRDAGYTVVSTKDVLALAQEGTKKK